MIGAERIILIGCLLQGTLGRKWEIWMPQSIEALSGSCVLIPCRFEIPSEYDPELAQCTHTVKGKWSKDETLLFDSSKQSGPPLQGKIAENLAQKNCTTVLENLPLSYSGQYHFRLECDTILKATFPPPVEINITDSPPKPKLTPEKMEVMEGTSVSLSCSAAAPCPKLPPNLTWTPRLSDSVDQLQENEDETKSVSSDLIFTASHLHHGQKITCRALYTLQQGGNQTSEASLTLTVLYMPQISGSGSCSRTAAEISCSCESRGNPSPSMEWRVSGLRVTNSTDRVIREEQLGNTGLRSSLTMRHSQGDTATLLCLSTNALGTSSLQLHDPCPQQHSDPPKKTSVSVSPSGSVLEGSSVTLTCSSKASPPVQNYTWYRVNGTAMNTVGTGQNLTFNVTESSGSEQYYCEAQNEHGKENSATVQLGVNYPPKKTSVSVSPSGSVLEGSSVTLTCISKASPPVQNYTWYRVNGTEINTVGTGQNLTFNVIESSDSEQYYCEAQNEHGKENSTTVLLNVIYMPQISGSGSCSRTAAEISCSCESRGNPSPSMEWRVSGLRVTNSTVRVIREEQLGNTGLRSSLTMRHSQGDMATLLCLSTNALGTSSLQLHAPSPQQHSGLNITSLLIGAAAGVGAMMVIFLIMKAIQKQGGKKTDSQCCERKEAEGSPPPAEEDPVYANHSMATTQPRDLQLGGTDPQPLAEDRELETMHYSSIKHSPRSVETQGQDAREGTAGQGDDVVYSQVVLEKKTEKG
ncbi:myelin-associated glycoprotein-like [Conger conger]|uniref:myelin-associated glycoprotein-like n=1 Tax=Conger conger TaxID=82655 RepID=UPI002A5A029C|nr:myelin-associated glycoprotein-like [Conger conger]